MFPLWLRLERGRHKTETSVYLRRSSLVSIRGSNLSKVSLGWRVLPFHFHPCSHDTDYNRWIVSSVPLRLGPNVHLRLGPVEVWRNTVVTSIGFILVPSLSYFGPGPLPKTPLFHFRWCCTDLSTRPILPSFAHFGPLSLSYLEFHSDV